MAHNSKQDHDIADSNSHGEGDLSAQPSDEGVTVAVDGLFTETAASSSESVASSVEAAPSSPASSLPSEQNIEIVLDKPTLKSPFHSPKPPTADGMSDATLDDGEIRENLLDEATQEDTLETSGEVVGPVGNGDRGERIQDTSGACRLRVA
ncbi:hypothetical protein BDU57DRAFT_278872 [Ampelomyces quisqualis]|uniref:Uncharacterized protein n=1 Tax=Ampelomyces quisqualis TaxID=50730 RepID=A0A6A5QJI6_AMPQU|nr:hypothetical protein BDU57DRAFT_278872 [Ampelomyces quisqualis]